MKKSILLLFCFVAAFATVSNAQQYGVKAGLNGSIAFAYGSTQDGESAELQFGYQAGFFYEHNLSEKLDLMVELNFERKGTVSKRDYSITVPATDEMGSPVINPVTMAPFFNTVAVVQEIDAKLSYINIPILFRFNLGNVKPYIGPNIGFMLKGKGTLDRTINITSEIPGLEIPPIVSDGVEMDFKEYSEFVALYASQIPPEDGDYLNSFEFGLNIGAIYDINENMFVDLRISQGLADLTNDSYNLDMYPDAAAGYTFPYRDDKDRNLSLQLSFGYRFGGVTMEDK